ncbi:MAG TPA: galactokinase [Armatimonadota bacterium]|nr:galactokinase [Armatimonadota bacterium]
MEIEGFLTRISAELDGEYRLFRAPGRVNLIGEHTDYNDGFVLPAAIDREVLLAARPGRARDVTLHALDCDGYSAFSLDEIGYDTAESWSNYLRGVCYVLEEADYHLRGADIVFAGDVPIGSGLSSSAALEVAAALAFLTLAEYDVPGPEIARLCQRAENAFVGNRCGIMDQFISVLGQPGHALLIDCRTLDYQPYPIPAGVRIVIGDTGVRRGLVESAYNERREQCEAGVAILEKVLPGINALRDVLPTQLEAHRDLLPEIVYRRCRHVVSENARVLQAVKAMAAGDLPELGRLLNASHDSLRGDYAVSCPELDALVEIARRQPGVYGSRMTGAGFGGCTVSLVAKEHAEAFVAAVGPAYTTATGLHPQIYVCQASAGAEEVELEHLV